MVRQPMSRARTATISAQPGPQTRFLQSSADIVVFGGAAGCGKTFVLIVEALRHVGRVANIAAVFFRRTTPQITNPGALWDQTLTFYPQLGGTPHVIADSRVFIEKMIAAILPALAAANK